MLGRVVGLQRLRLAQIEGLVDESPAREVVPVDKGDGSPGLPCAPGAADAVDVRLFVFGALVVDDVGDVVDVDASGRDVGGDEDVDLAVAEGSQRLLARALAEVSVERAGGEAPLGQLFGEACGGSFRPREDDRQAAAFCLEDAGEDLGFVEGVAAVDHLAHRFDRHAGVRGVRRADVRGPRHVPPRHRDDGPRHRRGKKHRVAVGGRGGQDFLDVLEEAQIEHFVGLVEDDGANVGQVEESMFHQIDEPAGGSHDDLCALFQSLLLGLVGAPTVHLDDAQAPPGRGGAQLFGHLLG